MLPFCLIRISRFAKNIFIKKKPLKTKERVTVRSQTKDQKYRTFFYVSLPKGLILKTITPSIYKYYEYACAGVYNPKILTTTSINVVYNMNATQVFGLKYR
ncbi:unnamed protein product [Rhizopus stolonifer]